MIFLFHICFSIAGADLCKQGGINHLIRTDTFGAGEGNVKAAFLVMQVVTLLKIPVSVKGVQCFSF